MPGDKEFDKVSALVAAWFAGEHTMFDACTEEPEIAWQAVIKILSCDLTDEQRGLLAAGPLETLLAWHGAAFIDRVTDESARSVRFKRLLKGVWRQEMSKEIWERIERARQ